MRSSDINKQRKLRFGQAIMLGVEIRSEVHGPVAELAYAGYGTARWYIALPPIGPWHDKGQGYIAGPYLRRWEAVNAALDKMGVS